MLAIAVLFMVAASAAAPLHRTCATDLDESACAAAVEAVLRRGMPEVHPLILATHVEPGSAAHAGDYGHRATVEFDLLGVPGPTEIELHFDQGAHWGGVADRSETELQAWAFLPLVAASLTSLTLVGLVAVRRRATTG